MTDIERRLSDAMHAAVDGEQPPGDLIQSVMRRRRRYLVRVAGVAVIASALVIVVPAAIAGQGDGRGDRPGGPRSASPTSFAPSSSPRPSRSPKPTRSPKLARRPPALMRGAPMPRTPGLRLLLTGRAPGWFTSATGQVQPIAGLPWGRTGYAFTRITGGWSALAYPRSQPCVPDCAGPRSAAYFVADGSPVASRVGTSHQVSAATGPGELWLARYRPGITDVSTASATATEVSPAGRRIGSPVRLPAGYLIQRAVGPDLLLMPVSQGQGPVIYRLFDPYARRVVRTFADVIAASPEQIAWGPICSGCAVHVLDLPTGRVVAVPVPPQMWAYMGTFSADGRLLAVQLSANSVPGGEAVWQGIGVIDVSSRLLTVLPGSGIRPPTAFALSFGWQPGGHLLIAVLADGRTGAVRQIASWHPGASRLLVGKLAIPHGMSVVLGEYG